VHRPAGADGALEFAAVASHGATVLGSRELKANVATEERCLQHKKMIFDLIV
jgi:hypothetical protein